MTDEILDDKPKTFNNLETFRFGSILQIDHKHVKNFHVKKFHKGSLASGKSSALLIICDQEKNKILTVNIN